MAAMEQQARHAAAAARRHDKALERMPSSPPLPTKPDGPVDEAVSPAEARSTFLPLARARSRGVARALNDAAVSIEEKRKSCDHAMTKAAGAREAFLEATVCKAGAYREKAIQAAAARERMQEAATEKELIAKLQNAEVRRLQHINRAAKPAAPVIIVVDVKKRSNAMAPAGLLLRLHAKRTTLLSTSTARFAAAAARREEKLAKLRVRMRTRAVAAALVVARRERDIEAKRAKAASAHIAAAAVRAEFIRSRVAKAKKANAAIAAASSRREKALSAKKAAVKLRLAVRSAAATAAVEAKKAKERAARSQKVNGFEARRLLRRATEAALEGLTVKRHALAAERRASLLSARVAKAKLSSMARGNAVKLTSVSLGDGDVPMVKLSTEVESKTTGCQLA